MGSKHSKIVPMPMPMIVKRMNEIIIPEERTAMLDLVELIDIKLHGKKQEEFALETEQLKEANGMYFLLRALKKMVEDVEMVTVSMQLLENLKFCVPLVMDFIQYGGIDLMEKALRLHAKDDYVAMTMPKLREVFLAIGAPASIEEIDTEALHLRLCKTCQETIELERQKKEQIVKPVVIPRSVDRINRVMKFMDNFLSRIDVQIAALNAVISFARNADAKTSMAQTDVLAVVSTSLKAHADKPEVIWRSCMAYSLFGAFNMDVAYEITMLDIHKLLIAKYKDKILKKHPAVQQQILWMFGSLLKWHKSRKVLHKERVCVDFFKQLLEDYEALDQELENLPALKKRDEHYRDPLYYVSVPLQIRSFIRESGGEVLKEGKSKKKVDKLLSKNFKERRNFGEKPKFGTVATNHFTGGESGLVLTGNEDEFGNAGRDIPEWEKRLDNMHKAPKAED